MNDKGIARWKLFSPFLFLRLEYEERLTYNLASVLCGGLVVLAYIFLPIKPSLIGSEGLLTGIQSFVTILFPFFVAALVAVATFSRKGLDAKPSGGQVKLSRRNETVKLLTRRQFICFIFGYCASLSLILFVGIIISRAMYPWVMFEFHDALPYLRIGSLFLVTIIFSHMVIITFWGLYYLTDRINN